MKSDIFACPRAMNVFWQARCSPKIIEPVRKYGAISFTWAIRCGSSVKNEATAPGKSTISSIRMKLKENIVMTAILKHSFTLDAFPRPKL